MIKNNKTVSRYRILGVVLGITSVVFVSACATGQPPQILTKVQLERVTVPAVLLTVPDEPLAPTGRMQSAAADYLVQLKINDDECHLAVLEIAASQK